MGLHSDLRGQDLHSPSQELVENNSGGIITKLKVVTFTSMGTNYPQIVPISSFTDIVRGVVNNNIANGGVGYITAFGLLNNVDTSLWVIGSILYSDITGNLTTVVTSLKIGTVLKQDATNGIIFINNTGPKGDPGSSGVDDEDNVLAVQIFS
jgi:hypothetical protein